MFVKGLHLNQLEISGCKNFSLKNWLVTVNNNNEKFRSFKSKENIHKKKVGPYRGISY